MRCAFHFRLKREVDCLLSCLPYWAHCYNGSGGVGLDSWLGGLALAVIGDITLDAGRGDEVMMRHSHSSPVTIYLACLLYTCSVYTPKHESH